MPPGAEPIGDDEGGGIRSAEGLFSPVRVAFLRDCVGGHVIVGTLSVALP